MHNQLVVVYSSIGYNIVSNNYIPTNLQLIIIMQWKQE